MKTIYVTNRFGKRVKVNVPSHDYSVAGGWEQVGQGQEPDILSPFFVGQPTDLTVAEGETADFSIVAAPVDDGFGHQKFWLQYQWFSSSNAPLTEGGQFVGTTTNTLSILGSDDQSNNGNQFYCQITNQSGSVTSSLVTLTVNEGNSNWENDSMNFDAEQDNWELA